MGGGMGDMGGGDFGGGMFRLEADKPRKMTVATVCLEHGKLDPTPRMKYQVVPLAVVNPDPKVAEVCKLLGQRRVSQNTAQAAAWHLANGLSWNELAHKPKVVSKYTGVQMFFSPFEVQNAIRLVAKIYAELPETPVEQGTSLSSDSRDESISSDSSEPVAASGQ
jgi:hypothetical protein